VNWNCYDDIPQGVVTEEWNSRLKLASMYGCYCAVVVFAAAVHIVTESNECLRYNLSLTWYQKLNWGGWAMMKRLCFDFRSRWEWLSWRNLIVYTWRKVFFFCFFLIFLVIVGVRGKAEFWRKHYFVCSLKKINIWNKTNQNKKNIIGKKILYLFS